MKPQQATNGGKRRTTLLLARGAAALVGALALFTACGGDDTSSGLDGGGGHDASVVDAGPDPDGALGRDAAAADGGTRDAGAPRCPPSPVCEPRDGSGCSGEDTCVLATADPSCETSTGDGDVGASCTATSDCASGLACFLRQGEGVCGRICCGDGTTCEGGERCGGRGTLVDGTETSFSWCVTPRPCNVFEPASTCEATEGCYIVSPEGDTDCRAAGDGEAGAACASQSDCAPGFFCGGLTASACVRICELGSGTGPRSCPAGEGTCRAYPHTPAGTGLCTVEAAAGRG